MVDVTSALDGYDYSPTQRRPDWPDIADCGPLSSSVAVVSKEPNMRQGFANLVAILAVTLPAAVNSSRASIEARQRRLKRIKQLRADGASYEAAESDNQAGQEITHRSSGDHVIDREMVDTQLRQKRSIRTTASTGSGEESVGSGSNQPGNTSIGSYVEIFDAFSPLAQPAKILDFDGSTYTLEHGLSGAKLEGIHSTLVHPHEIYEAGSEWAILRDLVGQPINSDDGLCTSAAKCKKQEQHIKANTLIVENEFD
ncbi:hypothetical protein THAOC_18615 [Thalassiosira oceanica]|uniref:Uncharacterized protein n=1 Tax=Thalassiosira oceanica TaxID=159749 RepID=K0S7Q0_THAOC|nr:hypothetical protein THAOC_18615 [Thalassiosira oceanica]|eukprot:EJK60964.1 hypothetical protein THAOC_18615 [Thalassiosira oceanica]